MREIVETKPPVQSKTLWVNVIVVAVACLSFLLDHELVRDNADIVRYGTIAIAVANIVLRFLTASPLRFSTQLKG